MVVGAEFKKDVARRLYEERTRPGDSGSAFLDGLFYGMCCGTGMTADEFYEFEKECADLMDGLIEGEWE